MHNVRSKWVRLTAPHLKVPPQLNRAHCTPQQARAGLAESAARCAEMLAEALGGCGGRVEKFRRDGWAPPWPVGLEMLCYMLSHEADLPFLIRCSSGWVTIEEWQVPCVITARKGSGKERSMIAGRPPKPLSRGTCRRTCRKRGSECARPPSLSETNGSTRLTNRSC